MTALLAHAGHDPTTPQEMFDACHALMRAYGVEDWHLRISSSKRRLGSCCYDTRTLRLSRHLLTANTWEQVKETILHEIAHALAGPKHGHGPVWKATAKRVGAMPRASAVKGTVVMPSPVWAAWCVTCGQVVGHYHRRPRYWRRGYIHRGCQGRLQFRLAEKDEKKG